MPSAAYLMQACFKLLRCSFPYVKEMQTERNKACFKLLRCSFPYVTVVGADRRDAPFKEISDLIF